MLALLLLKLLFGKHKDEEFVVGWFVQNIRLTQNLYSKPRCPSLS